VKKTYTITVFPKDFSDPAKVEGCVSWALQWDFLQVTIEKEEKVSELIPEELVKRKQIHRIFHAPREVYVVEE
jgi:hypothetical protein